MFSNLDYGGYRDWRLPTIQELQSIAKFGGTNAADGLNEIGFSDVQWDYYWSSSPGDSFPKMCMDVCHERFLWI